MESRTVLIALVTILSGILSDASAEAADVCELSGGVFKGNLCFLPCDNPGEVQVKQPNGQLTCVPADAAPPDQPAAQATPDKAAAPGQPDQPAAPAQPDQPAAPAKQPTDDCASKGGVRLGDACFLPCPDPGETRVQLADGALKCVVIAPAPAAVDAKAKDKKAAPGKKKR